MVMRSMSAESPSQYGRSVAGGEELPVNFVPERAVSAASASFLRRFDFDCIV
jgi:hypothetical protein